MSLDRSERSWCATKMFQDYYNGIKLYMYEGADLFALYELRQIALLVHIENDDRHVAFAAECERRLVHDLETVFDRLVK